MTNPLEEACKECVEHLRRGEYSMIHHKDGSHSVGNPHVPCQCNICAKHNMKQSTKNNWYSFWTLIIVGAVLVIISELIKQYVPWF